MIQCKDCEFCEITENGKKTFKCDPFVNIKEPECIAKWQLLRLDLLCVSHANMMGWYKKMSPMQDKIFKYIQREMDDIDQADNWKVEDDQNNDVETDQDDYYKP